MLFNLRRVAPPLKSRRRGIVGSGLSVGFISCVDHHGEERCIRLLAGTLIWITPDASLTRSIVPACVVRAKNGGLGAGVLFGGISSGCGKMS